MNNIFGFSRAQFDEMRANFNDLKGLLQMNAEDIRALTKQVAKIGDETTALQAKVGTLEAAIKDSPKPVDPAVLSAFEELKAQVQKVDDLVPDAPVVAAPAVPVTTDAPVAPPSPQPEAPAAVVPPPSTTDAGEGQGSTPPGTGAGTAA